MQLPNDKYASLSIGRATSRGSCNLWALVQSNSFVDFNLKGMQPLIQAFIAMVSVVRLSKRGADINNPKRVLSLAPFSLSSVWVWAIFIAVVRPWIDGFHEA